VVGGRTFVYGLAVVVFLIGEKLFHAIRETGAVADGIKLVIARAGLDRFLGLVVLISLVVGVYLALPEIDRAMGEGALFRLFFERPHAHADQK
jgi:hypothetical protein